MPTETVKPSSERIVSLIVCAMAIGSGYKRPVPVISRKHSSMDTCSTTGAKRRQMAINALEFLV